MPPAKEQWLELVRTALQRGTLVKLTLSRYRGGDASLRKVFVRPVALKAGRRLSFLYRHATRDVTKNLPLSEALARLEELVGAEFLAAHLFTTEQTAELELRADGEARLRIGKAGHAATSTGAHDRVRQRFIDPTGCAWLHALAVTTPEGKVAKGMEAKFRQINKFVEVLQHLLTEAGLKPGAAPLRVVDMGCGKGYLTFAMREWLRRAGWSEASVRGIEARPELVELCSRVARANGFDQLTFEAGTIATAALAQVDVLVALHACDTATDDATAKGIEAGASLIVVAPCCHKELRPQLRAPPVLAPALRHGILRERQAEFVTDALRAALLEWAGYTAKVFEFISTEHTAKNLMIAAVKRPHSANQVELERRARELAAFYGIASQRLATLLGVNLAEAPGHTVEERA